MRTLFESLSSRLRPPAPSTPQVQAQEPTPAPPSAVVLSQRGSGSRRYRCRCGRPVFFRNSVCTACGTPLGFIPETAHVEPIEPGPAAGLWLAIGAEAPRRMYARCSNFETTSGCNWLVALESTEPASPGAGTTPAPASSTPPEESPTSDTQPADTQPVGAQPVDEPSQPAAAVPSPAPMLCRACRLNRTIPDLSDTYAAELWRRIELARRRLVSQLILIGLPVASRVPAANEDPQRGMMFDVLRALPGGPRVLTGHDDGLITLNLDEADDAVRERIRAEMREPYRTLLGHFRHEVGHYYWDRLVDDTEWLDGYRQLFGDETIDYAAALQKHYAEGPAANWALRHVSSYASTHPWEDWAETWAHYLHMLDTLDTALSYGLDSSDVEFDADPFTKADLWRPDDPGADEFLGFVNGWVELTSVLNELSRSMGQPDYYPFVLPRPVVAKLQFVHLVVQGHR